ncbi:MAG: hypothetical protein Q8R92_11505 [Deltaproteobacteria bacterium]|nr:hypothetical protein [Deltaproteobacteria bacterium]
MKVGWLSDKSEYTGGAELTASEFRAAAPEGVEIVDCPPGEVVPELDTYVVHNCTTYGEYPERTDGPVARYLHDLRGGFNEGDELIFCSPAQQDRYNLGGHLIPPPLDLQAFRPARQQPTEIKREGACCVGAFMNPGKGGHLVSEWADRNEPVDVWGFGPFMPAGPNIRNRGRAKQNELPTILQRYERFVFLPPALEPFGRCVVEAWAAGCELIVNSNVGARWWIENEPEALETAGERFWEVILA